MGKSVGSTGAVLLTAAEVAVPAPSLAEAAADADATVPNATQIANSCIWPRMVAAIRPHAEVLPSAHGTVACLLSHHSGCLRMLLTPSDRQLASVV